MHGFIKKSVNTNFIQDPIITLNNFNKTIETVPSERALAQNLLNSQEHDEIKILFIERIIELGYNSAYQILLKLRRLNQLFTGVINRYLQGRLNVMYKPNDFPLGKFQILEHNNFSEVPFCLRPNCFAGMPDEWHLRQWRIQYEVNNHLIEVGFELNTTLQQSLIFYFHAQGQLQIEPNNIICQSFVEIFESRLESFRSLCQNAGFQFLIDNRRIPRWLIMCMDKTIENNIYIDLYCPYTAYLFAQFLHACVSSSFIFEILQKTWRAVDENRILLFFEKYHDYDAVSSILNNFIHACYSGLGFYNKPLIQYISLNYLIQVAQRGWLNKASVKNCNLFQTTLNFLSHNRQDFQISALNLLFTLIEKELVDKSSIEELKLREIIEGKLLHTQSIDIQGASGLIFLLLINKEYIKDSSISYNDLILKVMSAKKDLFEPFKKLASFTVIKEPLIKAINQYLTAVIVTMQLSELVSENGILCECAKNGLIEKSIVKFIIKERKLVDLLSHSEAPMNVLSVKFFEYFKDLGHIDLSLIKEFNLIEKYVKAQCWHSGYCFCDQVDNKELFFGDIFRTWVRQFPEAEKTIIQQLIEHLQNQEEGDSIIKRVLFWFLQNSVYNLSDPEYAANLIEQIVPFIATPNSLLDWGDVYGGIVGRSAIGIICSLTKRNLLNKSQLNDLQIIEKCFTKNDFTAGDSDDASLADTVEEFFEVLVEKSLITRSELITQSIEYLSHSDLIIKNNVLRFLQWRPIDAWRIKEYDRIGAMFDITDLSLDQANYYFGLRTRIARNKDLIDEISIYKFQIAQEIMHLITIEKDYSFGENALKVLTGFINDNLMDAALLNDLQIIEKTFLHFDFNSSIPTLYDDELEFEIFGDIVEIFFEALIEKGLITQSELIHQSLQYLFHSEWKVKANVLRWLTGSTIDQVCLKEDLNLSQSLAEILPSAEFTKSTILLLHSLIEKNFNEHLSDNLDVIVKCFTHCETEDEVHCEAVSRLFINHHLDALVNKSQITRAQILIAIIKNLTSSELHPQTRALELLNYQLQYTIDPFIKVLCTMLGSNLFENQISVVDLTKEYHEELSNILELFQPHKHRFKLIIPRLGETNHRMVLTREEEEERSLIG